VSDDRTFGINALVLERSLGKRFVEGVSGKGGLAALVSWLDQLDFVKGIEPLLNEINTRYMFYDSALTKCAKEALKRPEVMREEEIAGLLGFVCVGCGKPSSIMSNKSTCNCKKEIVPYYSVIVEKLLDLDIIPSPETVLLWVAYDGLAEAYVKAFQALRMALNQISERLGWPDASAFVDVEFKDQLDSSFLYLSPGDTRLALQEKEILQLLIRGNIANINLDEAEKLIMLGIATVKFGHLFNQLFSAGANFQFEKSRAEFSKLYNVVNEKIRLATFVSRKEREKRTVEVVELAEKQYYPLLLLPKDYWIQGRLSKNIVLHPFEDPPIFSADTPPAINAIVGPSGSGKTMLMAAFICRAFEKKHELIFNVLGDEANSLTLANLPMFPCEGHTGEFLETLAKMGVMPHAIPTLNLTFMRIGETIKKELLAANPPTKFDRIIDIVDTFGFGFDFLNKDEKNPGVVNVLEQIATDMGYKRICGLINIRNLARVEEISSTEDKKTNRDIEIATIMMEKFDAFRQGFKSPSSRIVVDEASYLAPIIHARSGTATFQSSNVLSQLVKRVRKMYCSFDLGTQKWTEINPDVRAEATNVFFRELPKSSDKSSSQMDVVLNCLELKEGKAMREQLAQMMERGVLGDDFFWFWYNKKRHDIEVVKPTPPFFMINQPRKTNLEVFKAYEKFSGEKVLLDSWEDVPHLEYKPTDYVRKPQFLL
jgi:hypothetical protein